MLKHGIIRKAPLDLIIKFLKDKVIEQKERICLYPWYLCQVEIRHHFCFFLLPSSSLNPSHWRSPGPWTWISQILHPTMLFSVCVSRWDMSIFLCTFPFQKHTGHTGSGLTLIFIWTWLPSWWPYPQNGHLLRWRLCWFFFWVEIRGLIHNNNTPIKESKRKPFCKSLIFELFSVLAPSSYALGFCLF